MKLFIRRQGFVLRIIFLFFLWILSGSLTSVKCQTFAFQHITEKEGLPTRYLYSLLQDQDGYIWLSGEAGLLWYDGKNFQIPAVQKKIKVEAIRLFRDFHNQIWIQDLGGRILLNQGGQLKELIEIVPSSVYKYTEWYNHPNGDVYISNTKDVFVYNYEKDSLTRFHVENENKALNSLKGFDQTPDGSVMLLTKKGYYILEKGQSEFIPYDIGGKNIDLFFRIWDQLFFIKEETVFCLKDGAIIKAPQFEKLKEFFQSIVLNVYEDRNGNVWFSTRDGLLLLQKDELGNLNISEHLKGEVMGDILEDEEGNIWFSTSQNGIYKLPSSQVKIYKEKGLDSQIRFIEESTWGDLVVGFDNNKYKVLDKSFNIIKEEKLFDQNFRLYDFATDRIGDQYFFTSKGFVQVDEHFKHKKIGPEWPVKAAGFSSDEMMWLATGTFCGYYKDGKSLKKIIQKRGYSLYPVSDDEVWFGTIEGPYHFKNDSAKLVKNPALHKDIRDIELLENGNLLFATQKNGLYYYNPVSDSILLHLSTQNGLSNDYCIMMLLENEYIWLATKKGINKIKRNDFSVLTIGVDQGLPSNEINYIYKSNDQVYVATNSGIAVFDENIEWNRSPPQLQYTKIKIQEKDTLLLDYYLLDHDKNNIKIEFNGITFKNAEEAVYAFKMEGIDQDWVTSKLNIAQYPSLPPGRYTFSVKTKTTNSGWSEEKKLQFQIKKPFWFRWWFLVLSGLVLIGISYLVFKEAIRRRNIVRDMKISQLTALRAQMNPHFVFNALNSIQEFIMNKNTRSANKYLTRFARLMRNILNMSDKDQISLSKEIETLNLYLSLELLRFGDAFEYILDVDKAVDKDALYLPPMLIQPYVENAIKHGLMHQKGEKKLFLRFYAKDDYLVCEVEDNGVGRKKSSEIRKLNQGVYTSKATSLTDERLKLFNAISNNNSLTVDVIDLKDEKNTPTGTKVILKINSNFKGSQS